ncbi:hypothetical protein GCM10022222_82960 [Amycolatopsis ultiminotia]|uniref:Uncharacterized protein n=1 Tax=Amycolatopsis ultiminotia TaxID=543629 RepID=A0ABP6YN29_9PSEU
MSYFRKTAMVVGGLAILLGTGGTAFAGTGATDTVPGHPIACRPAQQVPPGTPSVPAQPIGSKPTHEVPPGTPSVPAQPITCQPAQQVPPGTPSVPALPIGHAE